MSESLRNDGRIWVPKNPDDTAPAPTDPRGRARLLPRAHLPELRQPRAARHVRRGPPRRSATPAAASAPLKNGVYLDFADAINRLGEDTIRDRYGNLFDMYERITGENPYEVPMRIYPAVHYTMGGLWVDYNLMTTIPGPVRRSARPTSPTTAPTASAPRR
jgi:succinate dehydrogenase / fumarate reductase flavoprotein subunit